MMITLTVYASQQTYPIYLGEGLLASLGFLRSHIQGDQVMIVSNDTVAPLFLTRVREQLQALFTCNDIILPDGEIYKDLTHFSLILDALVDHKHRRNTTLIALGGGVIGDMAGFAAACYQRGVNVIQIPTTLLAQVDASVGGKTAVNHAKGKNLIGAFHQPTCVVIDPTVLDSLPARHFIAGLAEVIKHALIADVEFFEWLESNVSPILAKDPDALIHLIKRCCEIKAEIVAQDEKEHGVRALLNLGHTYGHAIEVTEGYDKILHGEAVAQGIMLAADQSLSLSWLSEEDVARIKAIFKAIGLPERSWTEKEKADQFDAMMLDKKRLSSTTQRFVLLRAVGKAVVHELSLQ